MQSTNEMFETMINDLLDHDYAIMADFIPQKITSQLYQNLLLRLEDGRMDAGGIGQQNGFQKNAEIRSDKISWIDEEEANDSEQFYLDHLKEFSHYLNQTCYTGLNAVECHYAWYDKGSFYKKHRDQFKSDSGRKYSLVTYLNPEWSNEDGGQLVLHQNEEILILPKGGGAVFFESDKIEHEVLTSLKPRMSIAGWMKCNSRIFM
jgi:SM-20-related protein